MGMEAKEKCVVSGATQMVLILDVTRSVSRRFPGSGDARDERAVGFGEATAKVIWLPEVSLLGIWLTWRAVDLRRDGAAQDLFPAVARATVGLSTCVRGPEDRRNSEFVEEHADAVLRAVEVWQAWLEEIGAAVDAFVAENAAERPAVHDHDWSGGRVRARTWGGADREVDVCKRCGSQRDISAATMYRQPIEGGRACGEPWTAWSEWAGMVPECRRSR